MDTDTLPEDDRQQIANKSAPFIARKFNLTDETEFELAESLPVWIVFGKDHENLVNSFHAIVKNSGEWHSQIRFGGEVQTGVRARKLVDVNPPRWRIENLVDSKLAKQIDQRITWIDANSVSKFVARIVEFPLYAATAFWLIDENGTSKFVPIAQALDRKWTDLNHFHDQGFFETFSNLQPIVGLTNIKQPPG